MIRRFTAGILVALVASPVGIRRVVEQFAVVPNLVRCQRGQWRKRAHRAGNEQVPGSGIDVGPGDRVTDDTQADGDQEIATEVRVGRCFGGGLPRLGQETVGKPTARPAPKQIDKTLLGLGQERCPPAAWLELGQVS